MTRRKTIHTVPRADYPPGYFTALVREHRWPPMWEPAGHVDVRADADAARRRSKWAAGVAGKGWATGTMPMPGTPGNQHPRWMGSNPATSAQA